MALLRMGGRQTYFWGPWDEGVMMQPWKLKGEAESVSQQGQQGLWTAPDGTRLCHCPLLSQWSPVPGSRFAKATEGPEVNTSVMGDRDHQPTHQERHQSAAACPSLAHKGSPSSRE